jgi:hypothetical protein
MNPSRQPSPSPPSPAFWQERWHRLSPLARDIVVVLVIKAVALTALWFAFFRAPIARQMAMDPRHVEQQIVAPRPEPEPPQGLR